MIKGTTFRYLHGRERNLATLQKSIPLVIEPSTPAYKTHLKEILSENPEQILDEISKHGAVLLRGFDIKSEKDFEQAVLSIKGVRGMNSYFMSESGRTLIDGTDFVFYTNKFIPTGGGLKFGGFHNENVYSTDVPKFICFCCFEKPSLGGETGLVDVTNVYEDLNQNLKNKLALKTFHTQTWNAGHIAETYSITIDKVKEICSDFGLDCKTTPSGEEIVSLYKPSLIKNETNNRTALITNFSREIPGLHLYLNSKFRKDYKGWKWVYHQLAWKYPIVGKLGKFRIKSLLNRFKPADLTLPQKPTTEVKGIPPSTPLQTPDKMAGIFTNEEMKLVADSMYTHFSSFTWEKGDLLILDNLRIAHGGMPGLGSRVIRALLCNPIKIDVSPKSPGCQDAKENIDQQSLSEMIAALTVSGT